MAFAVTSKGAPLAGLLKKFLLAAPAASALGPRSVAGACRLFNTEAPPHRRDESNVGAPGFSYSVPSSWVSKDDDDALELKLVMLGMKKEQVKLSAYQDGLLQVKWDADDGPAWYSWSITLSAVNFKLDQIKAEMDGGLLTVTVPKTRGEVVRKYTDIKIE